MTNKVLLKLAAILEAATGLGLIIVPALVLRLLLGEEIAGSGVALGRIAGIALLSLGIACLPRGEATLPALGGMLTYNLLTASYLLWLRFSVGVTASLLMPAIVLHAVLTLLFIGACFKRK